MQQDKQIEIDFLKPAHFFNTVKAEGKELDNYEGKAASQEEIVLMFFTERSQQKFTADNVWNILIGRELIHKDTPYTSIRRAISNLTHKKKLEILKDELTTGLHGKPVHYYKLNDTTVVEYSLSK